MDFFIAGYPLMKFTISSHSIVWTVCSLNSWYSGKRALFDVVFAAFIRFIMALDLNATVKFYGSCLLEDSGCS